MIINYMSDLHLEFQDPDFQLKLTNPQNADVLILAGDITTKVDVDWIKAVSEYYPDVIYIMGNHEYYYGNLPDVRIKTQEIFKNTNVHVLENSSVCINGINFHGCTLWTDCGNGDSATIADVNLGMNDFRFINTQGRSLISFDTYELHKKSLAWLKNIVKTGDVVITHHAPSFKSMHPMYQNSKLNPAFMSDLELDIQEMEPMLWFHGHVHNSCDYKISDTRVLCNPRGYAGVRNMPENKDFNPNAIVEIPSLDINV